MLSSIGDYYFVGEESVGELEEVAAGEVALQDEGAFPNGKGGEVLAFGRVEGVHGVPCAVVDEAAEAA